MPGAAALIDAEEQQHDPSAVLPETMKLYMPSQMPLATNGSGPQGCLRGVAEIEERQRVAQCENSLSKLRGNLHAKRWLIAHRNANWTGQRQTTKAAKLFEGMGGEIDGVATRYRRGYTALGGLGVVAKYKQLRPLTNADLRLDADSEYQDFEARKKLARLGSRPTRNMPRSSRKIMSWIWTAAGALDDEEQHLHDCTSSLKEYGSAF
jgi:hypothetical protein